MSLVPKFVEIDKDYNYLRVKKDDWDKYYDCLDAMKDLVNKGKAIPKELFDEYTSYIENENISWSQHYNKYKTQVYENVMAYFKDDKYKKKYYFSYTYQDGFPIYYERTASFEELIQYVITSIVNTYSFQAMEGKNELGYKKIVLLYLIDKIDMYFANLQDVPQKPKYTNRMVYILSGFILLSFGYALFEKDVVITNPKVFYKVRDSVKGAKK